MAQKKRPWKRIFWICVPLVVLLTAAVVYAQQFPNTIDRDVDAIRALGYPTKVEEIWAQIPRSGKDASKEFAKFSAMYAKLESKSKDELRALSGSLRRPTMSPSRRRDLVKKYQHMLPPILTGSSMPWRSPDGRSQITKDYPSFVDFDMTVDRNGIGLLLNAAVVDAYDGNLDGMEFKVRAAQRMYSQEASYPQLLRPLLNESNSMQALAEIVENGRSPDTVATVLKLLEDAPPLPNLRFAFTARFVDHLRFVIDEDGSEERRSDDEEESAFPKLWNELKDRFYERPKEARKESLEIRMFRECFESLPKNESDIRGMRAAIQRVVDRNKTNPSYDEEWNVVGYFPSECDYWMIWEARPRVVKMGCRMILARKQSGSYPSSLGTFYGEDAIDPFTGKPLIYKPSARGFVIYSVGLDGIDDGGVAQAPGRTNYDLVFSYP